MNRFDIIQGKSPPPKNEEESVLPDGTIMGVDLGNGDSNTALILMQMEVSMAVPPDQSLQIGDSVGVDGSGRAILATNESRSIGVVLNTQGENAHIRLNQDQNQDSVVVGRTSLGQTTIGLLHEHPGLQRRLGVDRNHIIVDRRDWEIIRSTLAEENDSSAETIESTFSLEGVEEEIDPSPEEISVHPSETGLNDDWDEWGDGLPF
jgi:hypothetical protein